MEDNIRPPDNAILDCLLPSYETEEEQMRRAIEESENEYEFQFALLESRWFAKEREERIKRFANFRVKICQFMQIDKPNHAFYSDIIRYIDKYESCEIESAKVDEEFYLKFRRTLDNMRMTEENKLQLLELFKNNK